MQDPDPLAIIRKFRSYGLGLSKAGLEVVLRHLPAPQGRALFLSKLLELISRVYQERKLTPKDFTAQFIEQFASTLSISDSATSLEQKALQNAIIVVNPAEYSDAVPNLVPSKEHFLATAESRVKLHFKRLRLLQSRCDLKQIVKANPLKVVALGLITQGIGSSKHLVFQNQFANYKFHASRIKSIEGILLMGAFYLIIAEKEDYSTLCNVSILQPPFNKRPVETGFQYSAKVSHELFASQGLQSRGVFLAEASETSSVVVIPQFDFSQEAHKGLKMIVNMVQPKPSAVVVLAAAGKAPKVKFINTEILTFIVPNLDSEGPEVLPKIPLQQLYCTDEGEGPRPQVLFNPARLCIFGKEVIFFAADLHQEVLKLMAHSQMSQGPQFQRSQSFNELNKKICLTILHQGTLALGTIEKRPVFSRMDPYLSFRQAPDFIVLGDKFSDPDLFVFPLKWDEEKGPRVGFVYPGNFQLHGTFLVMYPLNESACQFCSIRG